MGPQLLSHQRKRIGEGVLALDRASEQTPARHVDASVWLDDALYFSTGRTERKAKNLALNSHCVVTTGCNVLEGLDLVVEGDAVRVTDETRLQRLADQYAAKYDQLFRFTVRDGAVYGGGGEIEVLVYELAPTTAFGLGKGTFRQTRFSKTRWRF
jgi:hypothetical protein